jgi:hypothetical protein
MDEQTIRAKFVALHPVMDERVTRLWAGAEADALGDGGIAIVERATGLTVKAKLDRRRYPAGIRVPDAEMDDLFITRADFHGEWNYTLHPRHGSQ